MPWHETGLPDEYLSSHAKKIAVCDFVTRVAADFIRSKHLDRNIGDANGGWSGPKGWGVNLFDYLNEPANVWTQAERSTSTRVAKRSYRGPAL